MTVIPSHFPCGGSPIPPSAVHSGDWIRVDHYGSEITAWVIGTAHGPGHYPGGAGIDYRPVFPVPGHLDDALDRGHVEYTAEQSVIRVWSGPIPGEAA